MERRNLVFQQLKPHCVYLSQAVLQVAGNNGNGKDVTGALSNLLRALQAAAAFPGALNGKLAEYVFFPISHVLREKQKLPVAALELTLQCLAILLQTGWRSNVDPALSHQLLILLPVLVAGMPSGQNETSTLSEELQAAALECLSELFITYGQNGQGRKALADANNIPPLGHAVMVILECLAGGPANNVQLAAAQALSACCSALQDRDALASFFPGITSNLAKVLTPSTKQRRSYQVLRISLEVLSYLFNAVISDRRTKDLPNSTQPKDAATAAPGQAEQKLTQSWLNATVAQVKLALANIIRIRHHERREVRQALLELCLTVLEDCRASLKDSAAMMIETMVVICGSDELGGMQAVVRQVITTDQRFAELLRSSTHGWVVSLPRVMQSTDDSAKRRVIHQISTGYELLEDQSVDLDVVDRAIAMNLRDGISTSIHDQSKLQEVAPVSGVAASLDLTLPTRDGPSMVFEPILYENRGQQEIVHDLRNLVQHVSTSKSSIIAARELVDSLRSSKGASQLASFWVAIQLLRSSAERDAPMDNFLDLGDSSAEPREELLEEMYTFSLDVLQQFSLEPQAGWRLQALAIETIAFQATSLKSDFRLELVDALYPVVHLVGSPNPQLRSHAITCLNIIAASCDYKDVGSLIVENVDYLVNAVALKLNTFDISPQAPQVLLMMIKLSGPTLLPYLDDLVGSVFAALESFHGYPKLVELLFAVLKGIAEEGVKTPQLAITMGGGDFHRKADGKMTTVDDIIEILQDIKTREAKSDDVDDLNKTESFPRKWWKEHTKDQDPSIEEVETDSSDENEKEDAEMANEEVSAAPDPPPPAPRVYNLLLSISELTQHYLSSSSPTLRTSLLDLLATTFPALAKHENSFLPLINTLWPVLVPRLDDAEAYVVANTLTVMAAMCVHARDFMRSRIEGVWPALVALYRSGGQKPRARSDNNNGRNGGGPGAGADIGGGLGAITLTQTTKQALATTAADGGGGVQPYYTAAPTRIIRSALVALFTTVVETVEVEEAAFHEVLELLLPLVSERRDVRDVFERRNADAVWLALLKWEVQRNGGKAGGVVEAERVGRGREGLGMWEGKGFAGLQVCG